jgi:hypothetical protein
MKSQKQRNRPPRPFKSPGLNWGGGKNGHNFIPGPVKPTVRPAKKNASPPAAKPQDGDTGADKS